MRTNPGTRLIAAASLALGLTFSLTGCTGQEPGRGVMAAENASAGVHVTEAQVQNGTVALQQLISELPSNDQSAKATPGAVLQSLCLRPIFEKAANELGFGVTKDDARAALNKLYAQVREQKPGARLPEVNDELVQIQQTELLNAAFSQHLQQADQKKVEKVMATMKDEVTKGWSFGPRYGGFAVSQSGVVALEPAQSFLAPYQGPSDMSRGVTDVAPNGRPIEDVRPSQGDGATTSPTAATTEPTAAATTEYPHDEAPATELPAEQVSPTATATSTAG